MPVEDKIKIFDADDKSLKILGELLSNDTSRRIIKMLIGNQCYTNEISKKLDIRVSLVIHHLKKLEEIGVLEITEKPIVKKGNHHRYFRMVPGLFLAPNQTKEEIHNSGFLKKIFKEGIKFSLIFVAGLFTWLISKGDGMAFDSNLVSDNYWIPLLIIIIGLIIERIFSARKKRKGVNLVQ